MGTKTKNLDGKPVNQPEPGWISLDGSPYEFAGTGTFLFEKVTRGRHSFYGVATGFDVAGKQADIDPYKSKYYDISIQLSPAYTLRIEPRDNEQKNSIIRGVSGVLADETGSTFRSNTTTGGTVLFTKLHEGTHSIRLRADGYEDYVYNAVRITKPDEMLAVYMTPKARVSVVIEGCPSQQIIPGQKAALSARATADRGVQPTGLVFRWTDSGQVADRQAIAVTYKQSGIYPVKLEAWAPNRDTGKTEKVAESVCTITVKEQEPACASVTISGGGVRIKPGQYVTMAAQVSSNVPAGALTVTWVLNNSRVGSSPSYIFSSVNPGTYYPAAEVWMNNEGKMYKLAASSATVVVEAEQQPQPKKPPEQPQSQEKKPATPSQPPQPRRFEQLSDNEKQGVLNCLCRCNSTGTSAVSISYNPKTSNASPNCAKSSNGPCINQGFGCWRHFPDGESKCAQGCYKSANVTGVPESVLKTGKDNGSADQKKAEAETKQYDDCVQSEKNRVDNAQKDLAKVGQKDAPMWFRCGDIGTDWQMIPSKACCDPFRRDGEKNMEAAAAALQRCGWNEEIQKRQADYNKKVDECKKKYPSAKH
jgi:phenylpyruvate tautomerase PptA (4-oxalocrotonate tautomerase family)